MRESEIERADSERIEAAGGMSLKFVSPGRNHVPDRISLMPIPEHHREIVAKYFQFTEYKKPGEKPRPGQVREHARLRTLGYHVNVVDTK